MSHVNEADLLEKVKLTLAREPADPSYGKKLVVEVAPTGAFLSRQEQPYLPSSPREVGKTVRECYAAGAAAWHVHCRDDQGRSSNEIDIFKRTYAEVFPECPDIITSCHVGADPHAHGADHVRPVVEPLLAADRRFVQMAVIPPCTRTVSSEYVRLATEETLQDMVGYLVEKGIQPEFQIHNHECINNVVEWLIEPGIIKPPYLMDICLGFHGYTWSSRTQPREWATVYLMSVMQMLPQGSVVGICVGGHNWLPLTVQGIMLGVDFVRIGMEETLWMYPHSNELIKDNVDVVKTVAGISRLAGREVATPAEARTILGLS